ncbi:hypothetical protein NLJ89_g8116 [Agrocybe chaxingu]|uniref:F-box domain-containing protein n=1 Tax=Agrocybe chaxingu TaxID=84603 RepID=A0A9W8JVC1_9AGAR|nr:hypothetical protein NLJ89_g8116 [Agrocybe chaxingu]
MARIASPIQLSLTHQNLRDERESLLCKAREIAQKCNTLIPIAKLPPEVLLRIFAIQARPVLPDKAHRFREGYIPPEPSKGLRTIAQICHYWRELVIGSPALWSIPIDCTTMPHVWAAELIKRSASMPLKVSMNFYVGNIRQSTRNFRMMLRHLDRMGDLDVYCVSERQIKDIITNRLGQPTPMLQRLALHSSDYYSSEEDMDLDPNDSDSEPGLHKARRHDLPDPPFQHSFHLKSLKTSGFIFRLDSPLYEHLTELSVSEVRGKAPTITEWAAVLLNTDKLTSLAFVNAFHPKLDDENLPQIHLPHLSSLRISGSFLPCSRLLFKLAIPPLHTLDVHVGGVDFGRKSGTRLMEALVSQLQHLKNTVALKFLYAFITKSRVQLASSPPDKPSEVSAPSFKISLSYPHSNDEELIRSFRILPFLSNIVAAGLLGALKVNNVDNAYPPEMQQGLIALIAPFINIPDLKMVYASSAYFVKGLLRRIEAGDIDSGPIFPLCLPQIEELEVQTMDWAQDASYRGYEYFLHWRKSINAPLPLLMFSMNYDNTEPTQCDALKPLCGKLVWADRRHNRYHRSESEELGSDDSMNVFLSRF